MRIIKKYLKKYIYIYIYFIYIYKIYRNIYIYIIYIYPEKRPEIIDKLDIDIKV